MEIVDRSDNGYAGTEHQSKDQGKYRNDYGVAKTFDEIFVPVIFNEVLIKFVGELFKKQL